ncbi:hypothetical protein BU16DRAFT_327412 [Lophium mytilinum]|uniref:HMG box domain-containing protein n=1 Tax=Lophium mytilinum TaxID=390894 RepID=A0A6A6R1Q5_9PEZI|nr:hypothetical protein BU16DRAFT_327412 [Lophium mytilinum]
MLTSRVLPPILRSPQLQATPQLITNTSRRDDIAQEPRMGTDAHRKSFEKGEKSATSSRRSSKTMLTRSASSPSPARHSKGTPPPSPKTSPTRITRKRAASLLDTVNNKARPEEQQQSPPTPRESNGLPSVTPGEFAGHVCLCQPEPKIPRPRNAFILYRQHHQQTVVARHPGLANPEISKIIGEQWQSESDAVKAEWKGLANEEKSRHLLKYPEYRYQPRRNGKPGALPENPSGQHTTVDKYRCPRCGGRSIRTPTSPFPTPQPTPLLPPPKQSPNSTSTTRFLPMMNNLSLESPLSRRTRPGPSNLSSIQVSASPVDTTMYSPLSPDSKRRRYNLSGYAPPSGRRMDGAPYYTSHARRDSLPPIRQSPPNTAIMPPPRTPRRASVDMSLNNLPAVGHDQSRSVEAMVMSVPYPVKIKVLGKITPPLKTPGLTSPANAVRGAIISVEGDDLEAVKELCLWLEEFLKKDEFKVQPKTFDPPKLPDDEEEEVTFADYLDIIKEWHGKSKEMIEYITTLVASEETPESVSKSDANDKEMEDADKAEEKEEKAGQAEIKPVVILPTYQLHASNVYTSRIPIADAYSPTDHWQWMATLWRGTVGPDLTIYIRDAKPEELQKEKMVDLLDEIRCLTVRKEKGSSKVEDSALRRIGFEVGEWIRTVGQEKSGH